MAWRIFSGSESENALVNTCQGVRSDSNMANANKGDASEISQVVLDNSPRNFTTSTPRSIYNRPDTMNSHDLPSSVDEVQEVLQSLPGVINLLQRQQEQLQCRERTRTHEPVNQSQAMQQPAYGTYPEESSVSDLEGRTNMHRMQSDGGKMYEAPGGWLQMSPWGRPQWDGGGNVTGQQAKVPKEAKERKAITTKTFAKGMMDVSLLTSNATQLRSVMSSPDHEFYTLLIWLISVSVVLQILSSVLLIMSDFYKTQVKEVDRRNQRKRKTLNFLSLALITIVTSLNVLISAFYAPGMSFGVPTSRTEVPQFSPATMMSSKHSEL